MTPHEDDDVNTYNPVVRTFGQVRQAITSVTGVPRRAVRPDSRLSELLPETARRQVWDELARTGLKPPSLLQTSVVEKFAMIAPIVVAILFAFWIWHPAGLLAVVPLWIVAFGLMPPAWATELPHGPETVGQLALFLTRLPDHPGSGYRWTRDEIQLKVRMIVAEWLGFPLAKVQPHHSFTWDLMAD